MADSLVSIITPSYNSAKYIAETISCIRSQVYSNWELLITDDCSTDNTVEIIESFVNKDPRIKLFCLEKNSGAGIARNNSIREAKGKYIAFCDSDDLWYSDKLSKQIAFMETNKYDFTFTQKNICNAHSLIIRANYYCPRKVTYFENSCFNRIGSCTVIYNADNLGKVYMPDIRKRQDWALWLLLLRKTKFAYGLKEVLSVYRKRNDSISADKRSLVRYQIIIYRDILNYSLFRSYFMLFFVFPFCHAYKRINQRLTFKTKGITRNEFPGVEAVK